MNVTFSNSRIPDGHHHAGTDYDQKASPLVALIVVPVVTGIISCFFIAVVPEGAAEGTQGVVNFSPTSSPWAT